MKWEKARTARSGDRPGRERVVVGDDDRWGKKQCEEPSRLHACRTATADEIDVRLRVAREAIARDAAKMIARLDLIAKGRWMGTLGRRRGEGWNILAEVVY